MANRKKSPTQAPSRDLTTSTENIDPVTVDEFPNKLFINPLYATPASIAYALNSLAIGITDENFSKLDNIAKTFFQRVQPQVQ